MKQEPAITVGTIGAAVAAVLAVLVAFGVPLSAEQQTAILGAVATLAPLVVALIIRRTVWAPSSVDNAVQAVTEAVQVAPEAAQSEDSVVAVADDEEDDLNGGAPTVRLS